MKYRLKKDIPGAKAGEEFETITGQIFLSNTAGYDADDYPDFFEPLPKTPVRWRAEEDDIYRVVNTTMKADYIQEAFFEIDHKHYKAGNYFRTEQQAQAVADAFNSVLAYVHEPSSGYDDLQTLNDDFNKLASLARYAVQGDV